VSAWADAEPVEDRFCELRLELPRKGLERRSERVGLGEEAEGGGELDYVPMDRFGLAGEGVEAIVVEIGGGEGRLPIRREAPGAVVEALAGDRDIVAVEDAMDEAGGDVGGGEAGAFADDVGEQAGGGVLAAFLAVIVAQAIIGEALHLFLRVEPGEALEGADADMAVLEPDEDRGAGGGGLIVALQSLAGLDQREGLGGLDAQCLQHLGGEDLAHAALQSQTAVAEAGVGGLARALGAEIEQPARAVAELGEEETPPVADVGIIGAELVPMIAQRQRLGEVVRERLEAAEAAEPLLVRQGVEPDRRRPAVVAEAKDRLREIGGADGIVEGFAELEDRGIGRVGGAGWLVGHRATPKRRRRRRFRIRAGPPASRSRPPSPDRDVYARRRG